MANRDTDREAGAVQREVLRTLGGAARVELAFRMSHEARAISLAGICSRNPRWSAEQAQQHLLRRILGDELWKAAYEHGSS